MLLKTDESLSPLFLRVALGVVIFPHGAQKLMGWFGGYGFEGTMGFLTGKAGLPYVVALLVIIGEFFGALGLITGLLTRFCAGSITLIMAGAMFMMHWNNGFFMNWSGKNAGEGFEFHILAIGIALALVLTGGGRFSLDKIVGDYWNKKVS